MPFLLSSLLRTKRPFATREMSPPQLLLLRASRCPGRSPRSLKTASEASAPRSAASSMALKFVPGTCLRGLRAASRHGWHELLRCQYVYFCTIKASKLSTLAGSEAFAPRSSSSATQAAWSLRTAQWSAVSCCVDPAFTAAPLSARAPHQRARERESGSARARECERARVRERERTSEREHTRARARERERDRGASACLLASLDA